MASVRFKQEKNLSNDELRIHSEKIDSLHLGFDWPKFRQIGMKIFDTKPCGPKLNENDSMQMNKKQKKVEDNIEFKALCDKWNALRNANNVNVVAHKDCGMDPSDCPCIKRIVFVMNVYHEWCEKNEADDDNINGEEQLSMVEIIDNLPFYSQIDLYNDYCHLLDFHSSQESFWQFVNLTFCKCELTKCKLYMRNHRSRDNYREISKRKELFFGFDGSDNVINIQFLDRLHAFFLHSNTDIVEEQSLYHHVIENDEKKIEEKLKTFQDFRIKQQKKMEKCQINIANNSKFITEIDDDKLTKNDGNDDDDEDQKSNNNAKSNDTSTGNSEAPNLKTTFSNPRNTELNEYSFGATFKYWDHFSHKKVYVVPKYTNLKEEMMTNSVYSVSECQWKDTLYKAIQIKMSYKGQSLHAINRGGTNNHYSIPRNMPISLSHIMVVLFYCNFDSLQRKFKLQCRPTHKKESRASLNERNSEIGHWFSLLKEVCWFFGQAMKKGDIFYHGINKTLLFTQFHARFRFPLSTTTSLKEAALFANFHSAKKTKKQKKKKKNKSNVLLFDANSGNESESESEDEKQSEESNEGIIIELGHCELCFYIDVQMMSDFPAENEKLFFGADLAIQNIYYQNKSYKKFVSALTLFQSIINGRFFVDILSEKKVFQQILLLMIGNFQFKYANNKNVKKIDKKIKSGQFATNMMTLNDGNDDDRETICYNDEIPEYIQDLFEYFYLNQHYVWIIESQLTYLEPSLRKYFVPTIQSKDDKSQSRNVLNLIGDDDHQHIKAYPLKYCTEYIWRIHGNDLIHFKNMKEGEWLNSASELVYTINVIDYEFDESGNENEAFDERCQAIFQCSCAPSRTGKHSFFMKVNSLTPNLERILFGVDLFCPAIKFKTCVPRRWFKQSDYLGYTMFDSDKLKEVKNEFEWHIAIKIYDYKRAASHIL